MTEESRENCHDTSSMDAALRASRRGFILASLGLVAGCSTAKTAGMLPSPPWPEQPEPTPTGRDDVLIGTEPYDPVRSPVELEQGVIPRTEWAMGRPVPSKMDLLTPVQYITVHHDGMSPFFESSRLAVESRIEAIRKAHRGRGWGDIGYHYIVDRGGRVWEGRPIRYQGAHVKDYNVGNIGVMALGNFERQQPNAAQLAALYDLLSTLMWRHRVSVSRVKTHQEWAATLCPGRHLQRHMVDTRSSGRLG